MVHSASAGFDFQIRNVLMVFSFVYEQNRNSNHNWSFWIFKLGKEKNHEWSVLFLKFTLSQFRETREIPLRRWNFGAQITKHDDGFHVLSSYFYYHKSRALKFGVHEHISTNETIFLEISEEIWWTAQIEVWLICPVLKILMSINEFRCQTYYLIKSNKKITN